MKINKFIEKCRKKFSLSKIDEYRNLHIKALEKILKWLESCLYDQDCKDYDLSDKEIEDALERFKEDNSLSKIN